MQHLHGARASKSVAAVNIIASCQSTTVGRNQQPVRCRLTGSKVSDPGFRWCSSPDDSANANARSCEPVQSASASPPKSHVNNVGQLSMLGTNGVAQWSAGAAPGSGSRSSKARTWARSSRARSPATQLADRSSRRSLRVPRDGAAHPVENQAVEGNHQRPVQQAPHPLRMPVGGYVDAA